MSLVGQVEDIDVQVDIIRKLIDRGAERDAELAAGLATSETLTSIQAKLDQASAACVDLDYCVREVIRSRN